MFDRRSATEVFRAAVYKLTRGDPHALANILQVPTVSPHKVEASSSSSTASQQSLQSENGTDWSGVLNAWLDACEASAEVRITYSSCTQGYIINAETKRTITPLKLC